MTIAELFAAVAAALTTAFTPSVFAVAPRARSDRGAGGVATIRLELHRY